MIWPSYGLVLRVEIPDTFRRHVLSFPVPSLVMTSSIRPDIKGHSYHRPFRKTTTADVHTPNPPSVIKGKLPNRMQPKHKIPANWFCNNMRVFRVSATPLKGFVYVHHLTLSTVPWVRIYRNKLNGAKTAAKNLYTLVPFCRPPTCNLNVPGLDWPSQSPKHCTYLLHIVPFGAMICWFGDVPRNYPQLPWISIPYG